MPKNGDSLSHGPGDQRQTVIDNLKAQWLLEKGSAVPFIKLDLTSKTADQLIVKQAEYKERLAKIRAGGDPTYFIDTKFKTVMLGQLLESGGLDFLDSIAGLELPATMEDLWSGDPDFSWALLDGIHGKNPENKNPTWDDYRDEMVSIATNAFLVLRDYANNDQAALGGGTGLLPMD
jgi:hypothetical protein